MKRRRTMLYVPGSHPSKIQEAPIYGSDSIMIDLEDAIAPKEKDAARLLTYHALRSVDFMGIETVVRINSFDSGHAQKDIEAVVRGGVDVVRLPKTEKAEDLHEVEAVIAAVEKACGRKVGSTKMMAAIESPLGVLNALSIATATERLIGIAIGAEDFVTAMHTTRSPGGMELLVARSQILMAARAAGIMAIDTVYSDLDNMEGFEEEVRLIKQLGFDGKSVIHPSQVAPVHRIYTPETDAVDEAKEIIRATKEAEERGSGVITVRGKMVDKPMIERAQRVLALAGERSVS